MQEIILHPITIFLTGAAVAFALYGAFTRAENKKRWQIMRDAADQKAGKPVIKITK